MLIVPRKRIWTQQPQGGVFLNPFWLTGFNAATKTAYGASGSIPVGVTSSICEEGQYAPAFTSSTFSTGMSIVSNNTKPIVIAGVVLKNTRFDLKGSSYGWCVELTYQNATTVLIDVRGSWYGGGAQIVVPCNNGECVRFAAQIRWVSRDTYNRFNVDLFANGKFISTVIGGDEPGTIDRITTTGGLLCFAASHATIALPELKDLSENPWQIFRAPDSSIWVPTANGGVVNTPVNPTTGSITLSGYAPTVTRTANASISPAVGTLVISGHAPVVARTANRAVVPGVGTVSLTGYAPTVDITAGNTLVPAPGALTLSGHIPTVTRTSHISLVPGVGGLTLTGFEPTVVQAAGSQSITPLAGSISIIGHSPSVVIGTSGPIDYDKLAVAMITNPRFLILLETLLN